MENAGESKFVYSWTGRFLGPLAFLRVQVESVASGLFSQNHVKSKQEYTLPVDMAHSSNVIIHGGTFNSVQGDFHIYNKNSEGCAVSWKVPSEQHRWLNEGLYDL